MQGDQALQETGVAGYITRFGFAQNNPFPTTLVPLEVTVATARQTRTKLLAFWFTAGFRDLIAVWDAASEQAVQAIVDEVTSLGGITCETVCVFSDQELAERVLHTEPV
jgi:hypothetical protein